jgi:hypothetical protein
MDMRIAVDLAGAGQEKARTMLGCQVQQMHGAFRIYPERFDGPA